jgi:predicted permease
MNLLRSIFHRLRSVVQRGPVKQDIDEELRFHIEQRTAENIAAGMSPEDATKEARKRFGNVQSVREECREVRCASLGETLLKDIRFGVRMLQKNPGFTAVAVLTLALGIGANTAIFSAIRTVLFDPLPVSDPDRFIQVIAVHRKQGWSAPGISPPAFESVRQKTNLFARSGVYEWDTLTLQGDDFPEPISGSRVTPAFFSLWTMRPQLGRTFTPDEANPGHDDVIILSHQMWQSHYGGDPGIIGRSLRFKERSLTVVGVMPAYFSFPSAYYYYWRPYDGPRVNTKNPDGSVNYGGYLANTGFIAELRPGVEKAQVQAYLDVLSLQELGGARREFDIRARELRELFVKPEVHRTFWALLGASVLTLLIACANVANLQLARTEKRHFELAVRSAVGAGRLRLVRQLLTESVLLASIGGLAGLALTAFGLMLLEKLIPPELPRFKPMSLDFGVFVIASIASLATGIAFGLAPAWRAGSAELANTLKLSATGNTRGLGMTRFSRVLITGQIALALVLLTCAGLMVQTVARLLAVNPGFDPNNLVMVYPGVDLNRYLSGGDMDQASEKLDVVFGDMRQRMAALLGEKCASIGLQGPDQELSTISGGPGHQVTEFFIGTEGANTLEVMRAPLKMGRWLEPTDANDASPRVLVNETGARLLWPGENPVGKRLWPKSHDGGVPIEVVGLVGDTRMNSYDEIPSPTVYKVLSKAPILGPSRFLLLRTSSNPATWHKRADDELKSAGADSWPPRFVNVDEQLKSTAAGRRTLMLYLSMFAGVALFLSAIGLYGVLAYSVARRTKEIGTRLALGASRWDVLGLIARDGMLVTGFGTILGVGGALVATRVLRAFLFGVTPQDTGTFAVAAILIDLVAMLACWLPARKAANVDPMVALRYE